MGLKFWLKLSKITMMFQTWIEHQSEYVQYHNDQ